MSNIFRFKQFSVDQTGCAMKVNTDGVLLAALIKAKDPENILEIGTGTGVIALMIAQKYSSAHIDAVEIDESAASAAEMNFENSAFADRLRLIRSSFQEHFKESRKKYDLVISNPRYFINSLKPGTAAKGLARHTDADFFEKLLEGTSAHLNDGGSLWLILPPGTAELITGLLDKAALLAVQRQISIHSFPGEEPYRYILAIGSGNQEPDIHKFVIYERRNVYSDEYRAALKDYLTIF